MSLRSILEAQLKVDEGYRSHPYLDTQNKITIGYGRNLSDKGISDSEAQDMLNRDMEEAIEDAKFLFQDYNDLNEIRQSVLANMAYNLGRSKLSKFFGLIDAIANKDFRDAANHMLGSLWRRQVGDRAIRLAKMMEDGE